MQLTDGFGRHEEQNYSRAVVANLNQMREDQLTKDEVDARHRPHHCTDLVCLIFFGLGVAGVCHIMRYAQQKGDLRRLFHGADAYGNLCGAGAGVINQPVVYWCTVPGPEVGTANGVPVYASSATLDLEHPICVSQCPADNFTVHACLQRRIVQRQAPRDNSGSFDEKVTHEYQLVVDVPTNVYGGRFCLPKELGLLSQAKHFLSATRIYSLMRWVPQVVGAWKLLVGAVILALMLGCVYVLLLKFWAHNLVSLCLVLSILLYFTLGVCYIVNSSGHTSYGRQASWDASIGIGLIMLSMVLTVVTYYREKYIERAIGIIETACDCMWDVPSILVEPVMNGILRILVLCYSFKGLLLLLSCGKGGWHVAFYIFMVLWVLELCTALTQFVVCYCTSLWFFKDYIDGKKEAPGFPLFRGYFLAICYHLGTLVFGSFLITTLRVPCAMVDFIVKQARGEGMPLLQRLMSYCACGLFCWERFLRFIDKHAYMCVVMDSLPFCVAAQKASRVAATGTARISSLMGACWIFQLAGVLMVTALGSYSSWLMMRNADTVTNPESQNYVEDATIVTTAAAILSFAISVPLMAVFDVVADTTILCWAYDRLYQVEHSSKPKNHVPLRLQACLAEHIKLTA